MKRKLYSASSVVIGSLMMASVAMADGELNNTITSESLDIDSAACQKAGSFTFGLTPDSTFIVGERVTIDLPPTVSVCENIDFVIAPEAVTMAAADSFNTVAGALWNAGNILVPPPVDAPPVVDVGGNGVTDFGGAGVAFRVQGDAGSQRVTFDVIGAADDRIRTSSVPGSLVNVTFFNADGATDADADGDIDGYYTSSDGGVTYDVPAVAADNAYCVQIDQDTFADGLYTIDVSLDSIGDPFQFQPNSNPEVAHDAPVETMVGRQHKEVPGLIPIEEHVSVGNDQGATEETWECGYVDNETSRGLINHTRNEVFFTSTTPFKSDLKAKLTIMVDDTDDGVDNPVAADFGIYFAGDQVTNPVGYLGYDEWDDIVAGGFTRPAADTVGTFATDYTYSLESGAAATTGSMVLASGSAQDCREIDAEGRALVVETSVTEIFPQDGLNVVSVDIPTMVYSAGFEAGMKVYVQVDLMGEICGADSGSYRLYVGEAIEEDDTQNVMTDSLLFPYFTGADDDADGFWDGIALVNTTQAEVTADVTLVEADGDVATGSVTIGALGMEVSTLGGWLAGGVLTQAAGAGTVGDSASFITVTFPATGTEYGVDGFAMIANEVSGESMGYLPRKSEDN